MFSQWRCGWRVASSVAGRAALRQVQTLARRIPLLPPGATAPTTSPKAKGATVLFVPLEAGSTETPKRADLAAGVPAELDFLEVPTGPLAQRLDLATRLSETGATTLLYPTGSGNNTTSLSRVLAVGLGATAAETTPDNVRDAAAAAVQALRAQKITVADFYSPDCGENSEALAAELGRAVVLADYRFDGHLAEDKAPARLESAVLALTPFAGDPADENAEVVEATVRRHLAVGAGTNFARDLANRRGDACTPADMETAARGLAQEFGLEFSCLQAAELEDEGLRLLLAVGAAATVPPRLVTLECNDLGGDAGTLLVVGKGVTFDTGGLNLKPTGSIEGMHMDMGGAAAVLGAARAVGELKQLSGPDGSAISKYSKVVFCVALAENAIGPLAVKPHEILRSHRGLSVSVGNTDAEGRLCLADALSWAQQRYGPDVAGVIDLATLTGACVVALGEYAAGVFANERGAVLAASLQASGRRHGEELHPLPILQGHRKEIADHDHADLCSTGPTRWGGACTAAAFLERFVDESTPWAHIDIAGPAMTSAERGVVPKGGTGFGAATITDFVLSKA